MYEKEYILNKVKVKENGKTILLPNIFDNIEVEIEDIKYLVFDENDILKILLKSEKVNNEELDETFFYLYDYINIVVGYYPELLSGPEFDLKNLAEKYKTQERYIKNDVCFIERITKDIFIESYQSFLKLLEKVSFPIDYYSIANSTKMGCYPQITIVNILQCFDGVYDFLELTSNHRVYFNSQKAKEIKRTLKNIDKTKIVCNEKQEKLEKQLNDAICRIEYYNYDDKLEYLFNYIDFKYNIFKFEKNKFEADEKLEQFIKKCKKTRNKFSHAGNTINATFDGIESGLYLEKLVLVFRLLIMDEIKLDKLINREKLNCLLCSINEWISSNLYKEGENNE